MSGRTSARSGSLKSPVFGLKYRSYYGPVAVLCVALLVPGEWMISARAAQATTDQKGAVQTTGATPEAAVKLSNDQLDSLVAPIALYPDPLLSQTLVASTYPLEIIQLQQWLVNNKDLKDKALTDAVKKQDWDPSIQGMALLPDVVKRLADDIKWTTDLGNAFLAQQAEVMDAVQRMRGKAQEKGNLKPSEQQKVETKVVESKQVIVIEQSNPEVIYVPSYNPTVVYGPPLYPYPPIYYPPPGYYAAGVAISFGIGIAMGAAFHGGWGYGCGWGHNDVNINVHNDFNRNANINRGGGGGGNWQHNPQHRGGAPYGDRSTANKFGGTTRGDSASTRQASARQQQSRSGGGRDQAGSMSRDSGSRPQSGSMDRGGGGGGSRSSGAFGGSSGSWSGSSARSSSSRGSSSFGGSRGGGGGRRR